MPELEYRPPSIGRRLAPWLTALRGKSGVYIIRENGFFGAGRVYVGESHTGKLYDTIRRHFTKWTGKTAGPTYARTKHSVAVIVTRPQNAVALRDALIADIAPRDNTAGKPSWA